MLYAIRFVQVYQMNLSLKRRRQARIMKSAFMKISVVIPAYNEELFLPNLLTSLKNQTFSQPFEIIVVDNNSTDKTAEIAKKFGARVIYEKKRGYAHACNAGFTAAKADIIARADADYVLPIDWLEKIWKSFEKHPDVIALGGPLYPLESHFWENIIYYPGIVIWMYLLKALGRGFLFPNMAVRKSAYIKTGGFNTKLQFGEDTEMCLALKRIGKVAFVPSIYIYTSIRRMRSLGFIQTVFGYSFGNQIAMWLGKEANVGLEPVRIIPSGKPQTYKPWIFLFLTPTIIVLLLLFLSSFFLPNSASEIAKMHLPAAYTMQTQIHRIQKNLEWKTYFPFKSLKNI